MSNHTRIHSLDPDYAVALSEKLILRARPDGDCWIYTGELTRGYGRVSITHEGRVVNTTTHRVMWLALRGDLPPGLVLDHRCVTPACMNPWHLDPVTLGVNSQRITADRKRLGLPETRGAKRDAERCRRGHDMTDPHNAYYTKSYRDIPDEDRVEIRRCFTCAVQRLAAMRRLPAEGEAA